MSLLNLAQNLDLAGFAPVPVKSDKLPLVKWKVPITDWSIFNQAHGIALRGGVSSQGIECIDFEGKATDISPTWDKFIFDPSVTDIIRRNKVYIQKTRNNGYHVIYRYESDNYEGSQVLARFADGALMIETRGENSYFLIAPSIGYTPIKNDLFQIGTMTLDERDYLLNFCRSLSQEAISKNTGKHTPSTNHHYTDPVSYFNHHQSGYAKYLLKNEGWRLDASSDGDTEHWIRPGKNDGFGATFNHKKGYFYVFSEAKEIEPFRSKNYYSPFQILTLLKFKGNFRAAIEWTITKYLNTEIPYIRVGVDYFKVVTKQDRFGIVGGELKKWNKETIIIDHGIAYLKQIPCFDNFCIVPSNTNYVPVIHNNYNLFSEFRHKPSPGSWKWSKVILEHIFCEQFDLGLRYLQALYLHPDRILPILVLVSKLRNTGKTTFLNWLNAIFGDNMVIISPEDLVNGFNHIYATSNIIAVEETLIEKSITVEKIKALSTGKFISVNQKFVSQYKLPFYGKIIMTSNNEDKFAKVDDEEIRFFVRKLSEPKLQNHNIEEDLIREIPAFLHHLSQLPPVNFSLSRMAFSPAELSNEYLNQVKSESRSWLYKEIYEQMCSWFENNYASSVLASPIDIKEKFFTHNTRVEINYIRKVLKDEFRLHPINLQRYSPFNELHKNCIGRPYSFTASMFNILPLTDNSDIDPFPAAPY